jgi:hypothetical protein
MPEVMMGVMPARIGQHRSSLAQEQAGTVPSSINVPLLDAIMTRIQYRGSELSDDTMPYRGIWLMTRKISSVNCGRG